MSCPTDSTPPLHRPYVLVLAGGGARGFAHVGVLRALEQKGLAPAAIVGVSMGAIVGATYSLNPDWYASLLAIDETDLPVPRLPSLASTSDNSIAGPVRLLRYARTAWRVGSGWGAISGGLTRGRRVLRLLTLNGDLAAGRLPVAVCATDLHTGMRVTLHAGSAAEAVYASSAMAGLLPPIELADGLLVDGAYADLAPIDVARSFGHPVTIAVDAGQNGYGGQVETGLQAMVRALEICHRQHAQLRFEQADLVLRPDFRRSIDVLDFSARRECVAAGIRAVRAQLELFKEVLC
jgi:NTE family protein